MRRQKRSSDLRFSGFTLVELLVVITIVILLLSTLLVVVRGVVGNARVAATKATIRKIDALLSKRLAAFERYVAGQDRLAGTSGTPSYVTKYIGSGAGANTPANRILAKKYFFRDAFPQSFSELASGYPPNINNANHQAATENAEMLYYMLTGMDSFGAEPPNLDEFKSGEVADTDNDGLPEFLDGWGNPLRYYRWPTRLVRPVLDSSNYGEAQSITIDNMTDPVSQWKYFHPIPVNVAYDASGASLSLLVRVLPPVPSAGVTRGPDTTFGQEFSDPLARDPQDPLDLLRPSGDQTAAKNWAQTMEKNLHTGNCYTLPLIVSAGKDQILGLFEPTDRSKFGNLAQPDMNQLPGLFDNITNLNVQVGGN